MRIKIRRAKASNYSVVDNTIMRDKRVGLKARGLWSTVMSLPETWDFSIKGIRAILRQDGRDAIYACLSELAKYGYCIKTQLPREAGKFTGHQYEFVEKPKKTPRPEKPDTVQPDTANPTQLNTDLIKYSINAKSERVPTQAGADAHEDVYGNGRTNWDDEDVPDDSDLIDAWVDAGVEELDPQPFLLPSFKPREKTHKTVLSAEPIPKSLHSVMYRICFRAETGDEQLMLSSSQRGKVASILGHLRDTGADFNQLHIFEAWWVANWRSRDRGTDQYQAPRPEQVLEHWNEAMKSGVKPKTEKLERPINHEVPNLTQIMRQHAETRNNE